MILVLLILITPVILDQIHELAAGYSVRMAAAMESVFNCLKF